MTGEHTCMLLKPLTLSNDEFEVDESEELGFFAPFYKGLLICKQESNLSVSFKYDMFSFNVLANSSTLFRFQDKVL